jgi:hypothetical protein
MNNSLCGLDLILQGGDPCRVDPQLTGRLNFSVAPNFIWVG